MVDSGYGLGGSLRAHRPALPKGQKYQMVKSSICVSVGLPIVWIRPMVDMGFLFCGVCWGTIRHASIKLVWPSFSCLPSIVLKAGQGKVIKKFDHYDYDYDYDVSKFFNIFCP